MIFFLTHFSLGFRLYLLPPPLLFFWSSIFFHASAGTVVRSWPPRLVDRASLDIVRTSLINSAQAVPKLTELLIFLSQVLILVTPRAFPAAFCQLSVPAALGAPAPFSSRSTVNFTVYDLKNPLVCRSALLEYASFFSPPFSADTRDAQGFCLGSPSPLFSSYRTSPCPGPVLFVPPSLLANTGARLPSFFDGAYL